MGCSEREDYSEWRREDGGTILIGVMVQPLWHLAWMIWENEFGQKWYRDWDKVRISIRTLNQTWSYEQSHWPEHFISIWSRNGKTLSCGWHKMTSDNKREGWRQDANTPNAKIPPPNLLCLAPCPVKLPSDVPSLGSAGLSDRYIIELQRCVDRLPAASLVVFNGVFAAGSHRTICVSPVPLTSLYPAPLSPSRIIFGTPILCCGLLHGASVHGLFFSDWHLQGRM